MNRATSPIGWARNPDGSPGWTWNPMSGCLNHDNGLCKGGGFPCYAYKLANGRLKPLYLANINVPCLWSTKSVFLDMSVIPEYDSQVADPFYPRFWEERLCDRGLFQQKPRGIFPCDMSDLFGIGVPEAWTDRVMDNIRVHRQHRFYLLTKQPQNLPTSPSYFPDNAWVGVTATDGWNMLSKALGYLWGIQAKVKYISFEPLLGGNQVTNLADNFVKSGINWIIIGACTGTFNELMSLHSELEFMPWGKKWTLQPRVEWVREITEACKKANIPYFLKDNLKPLLENDPLNPLYWANVCDDESGNERVDDSLRQEMPEGR